jgi:hypothetical protein
MKLLGALIGACSVLLGIGACGDSEGGVASSGGSSAGSGVGGGGGSSATGGITGVCTPGTKACNGNIPQTCDPGGNWTSAAPCAYVCKEAGCIGSCVPGETRCKLNGQQTCSTQGEWESVSPCEFGCEAGKCRSSCNAGDFNCYGNEIQQCEAGPPPKWVPVSPAVVCNPQLGQTCDAKTGTCATLEPIGTATPTGSYFQYAIFKKDETAFLGGYDVDSYGDYIYVNRGSQYMDVYKVVLHDSDGDGKLEPHQHPLNTQAPGPMEERTLEFIATYTKATDGAPMGTASKAEIYALEDRIFALGPTGGGIITEYILGTKATQIVVQPKSTFSMSFMGFGDADKVWYAGNESNRRVYSFHQPSSTWVAEFAYPNLAGSHMDGMEVVVAPKTGEQYVYVTDMTSDFIAQYYRGDDGWVQEALYEYGDQTSSPIEGFGFGAFDHFWATSGTYLYEIGGGDIQDFLEPCANGAQVCGGEKDADCPPAQYCLNKCCQSVQ